MSTELTTTERQYVEDQMEGSPSPGCLYCRECKRVIATIGSAGMYEANSLCGVCSRTSPTGAATEGS